MSIHATGAALDSLAADAPQFQTNGGDWDEVLPAMKKNACAMTASC
mgnify:CR=1 FL=1